MKIQKLAVVASVAALAFSLTACGSPERTFVKDVRESVSSSGDRTDAEVLQVGEEICQSADEHGPAALVLALGFGSVGLTEDERDDLIAITTSALKNLCPEHAETLKNLDDPGFDNTDPNYNPEG